MSNSSETLTPPKTWSTVRTQAEQAKMHPLALNMLQKITAPERAAARVEATRQALTIYCQSIGRPVGMWPASLESIVAVLDVHGLGGPLNAGGVLGTCQTARMSWARKLGTGRRQGADYDAYLAALNDAAITSVEPLPLELGAIRAINESQELLDYLIAYARGQLARLLQKYVAETEASPRTTVDQTLNDWAYLVDDLEKWTSEKPHII